MDKIQNLNEELQEVKIKLAEVEQSPDQIQVGSFVLMSILISLLRN